MAVDVLDGKFCIERDCKQPATDDHGGGVGRAVREFVADVGGERREGDCARQDATDPMPGRRRFTPGQQVEPEGRLRPGAQAEQVARAGHPCHRESDREQCRHRQVQQRVQQPRMPVSRLVERVAEERIAQDRAAIDDGEPEPHPGAAEQQAGNGGDSEGIDAQEAQVLEHVCDSGPVDRLEHLF